MTADAFSVALPFVALAAIILFVAALVLEGREVHHLSLVRGRWSRLRGHAQRLPYSEPVRPWCIKLKSGAYLAGFYISAPDGDTMDPETLGQSDAALSKAVQSISHECAAWFIRRRVRVRGYDEPAERRYPHWLAQFIDELQANYFNSGRTFASGRTFYIAWKPPSALAEKLRAAAMTGEDAAVRQEDDIIADFERDYLRVYETFFETAGAKIQRLSAYREVGEDGEERWYSELYSALSYSISHRTKKYRLPDAFEQKACGVLAEPEFVGGFNVRVGPREFAFVVVKGYPDELWPRRLDRLKEVGVEHSVVVKWLPMTGDRARKSANDARAGYLLGAGGTAGGNASDAELAGQSAKIKGIISRGHVSFGDALVYVVLSHKDRKTVDDAARKVVTLLDDLGIRSFRATLTAEADYEACLPGMTDYGVRRLPLHSVNVAHLVNFHEESRGRRFCESPTLPPSTPAVATLVTPELEPYRIHLNALEQPDVFMTYFVGGMGKGKSVAMALLAILTFGRIPLSGISVFDKGRSSYRLTRFLDGTFSDFLKVDAAQPGLALFDCDLTNPENRGPLLEIISTMIEINDVPLGPAVDDALSAALDLMSGYDDSENIKGKHLRSLEGFVELLQAPGEVKSALSKYCRDGELGRTLDCEHDSFDVTRWNVVEMDRLLKMSPKYVIPVLRAVYWKMSAQVDNMKASLNRPDLHWFTFQDEAHSLLEQPLGARFVQTKYREARRRNEGLALLSQSIGHFYDSDCWNDIKTACGVRYFFGNPGLAEKEVVTLNGRASLHQMYRDAGVPERGLRMLGRMPEFTFLYVTNDGELKRGKFHLDDATRALLGRTRQSDNSRVDEYIQRYGSKEWRWKLLKDEGVNTHAIQRLQDLYEQWQSGGDGNRRRDVGADLRALDIVKGDVA